MNATLPPVQNDNVNLAVSSGVNTLKFNVTTLSQPAAFVNVTTCVPDVLYVLPPTVTVEPAHITLSITVALGSLTVKFNVIVLSQPTLFVVIIVNVPLCV